MGRRCLFNLSVHISLESHKCRVRTFRWFHLLKVSQGLSLRFDMEDEYDLRKCAVTYSALIVSAPISKDNGVCLTFSKI